MGERRLPPFPVHERSNPTRPLDRPAADIARACRLLETRTNSLHRLLDAHRFQSTIQGQLMSALEHLRAAAESLELVSSSAPRIEEESRATLRGSVGCLLKGMGVQDGDARRADRGESLTGSNSTVPVPDILSFLANMRRSGVLWVDTLTEAFQIELGNGEVTYASSDNPPPGSRLGEILVQQGAITSADLYEFLQRYVNSQEMFGAVLEREGIITREQLSRALGRQMQMIFGRLFAADIATYHFAPGLRLAADSLLRGNVTHLLLDSAREADEQQRGPEGY